MTGARKCCWADKRHIFSLLLVEVGFRCIYPYQVCVPRTEPLIDISISSVTRFEWHWRAFLPLRESFHFLMFFFFFFPRWYVLSDMSYEENFPCCGLYSSTLFILSSALVSGTRMLGIRLSGVIMLVRPLIRRVSDFQVPWAIFEYHERFSRTYTLCVRPQSLFTVRYVLYLNRSKEKNLKNSWKQYKNKTRKLCFKSALKKKKHFWRVYIGQVNNKMNVFDNI